MTAPSLSIVIPALNEREGLGALLGDLARLALPAETIVVDGGSSDDTRALAEGRGATVLASGRGRGVQMRRGARAARAPLLLFLHADVRLEAAARAAVERLVCSGSRGAWAFRLRIAGRRAGYRVVEWGANLRSRLLSLPYGDQGLLVSRSLYDVAGGFADVPLMEDVMLARALRRLGGITLLPETITVSDRRWADDGVIGRSLGNAMLLARFLAGASPAALAARYDARR